MALGVQGGGGRPDLALNISFSPRHDPFFFLIWARLTAHRKYCMINGLDEIGLTLRQADKIRTFEAERLARHPWLDVQPIGAR